MLDNFSSDLRSFKYNQNQLVVEMSNQQHYKAKVRLPYSSQLIRLAMLVRYTSFQAYKLLQEHFPLPSLALLSKLRKGNTDALKVCSYLKESGKISQDITVMVDEMYLRKCAQYSEGKFIGFDEGDFYKGIMVFMIQGLKNSLPVVVEGCPITALNGKWLANEMASCIFAFANSGFKVRAIVTDNHVTNVNAFKALRTTFSAESDLYIKHSQNETATYLFFDNVHLIKNIRNNTLNAKKLFFPSF